MEAGSRWLRRTGQNNGPRFRPGLTHTMLMELGPAKWETRNARFSNAAVHRCFLRPGVSLRQGLPEAEVTHADRYHHRCWADSVRSAVGLPGPHPAFPEEIEYVRQRLVAICLYSAILLATVRPVGIYLALVLEGERTWLEPVLRPVERLIYKLSGVNAGKEMNWREYAFAMLGFSAVGMLLPTD